MYVSWAASFRMKMSSRIGFTRKAVAPLRADTQTITSIARRSLGTYGRVYSSIRR